MKIYGEDEFRYRLVEGWGNIPQEWKIGQVAGLGIDEDENIYILTRSKPTIIVLRPDGTLVDTWDTDYIGRPHDLLYDREQQCFYIVDDGSHVVYKYNKSKELVATLGTRDVPSDTGAIGRKYMTIQRVAGPFNCPTSVTISDDRKMYVSDGYGNARVHCFDLDGNLLFSWGDKGTEDGHFNLPHGVLCYNGLIYVCDRENNRLQVFAKDGKWLRTLEKEFVRPAQMAIGPDGNLYVAECKRNNDYESGPSRVTILSPEEEVLARIDNDSPYDPELPYHTAHGIAVDSQGNIYLGEVGKKKDGYWGMQKLERI